MVRDDGYLVREGIGSHQEEEGQRLKEIAEDHRRQAREGVVHILMFMPSHRLVLFLYH